jgi:hypothetical protein
MVLGPFISYEENEVLLKQAPDSQLENELILPFLSKQVVSTDLVWKSKFVPAWTENNATPWGGAFTVYLHFKMSKNGCHGA